MGEEADGSAVDSASITPIKAAACLRLAVSHFTTHPTFALPGEQIETNSVSRKRDFLYLCRRLFVDKSAAQKRSPLA